MLGRGASWSRSEGRDKAEPRLKPYLLQLKERFVSYKLKNAIHLKHFHSIRIYELLKQYEKIGTRDFELTELMQILGITEGEYKLYGNFKRKVLLPVQKELPQKTDLQFTFKEIKTGHKVTEIEFFIRANVGTDTVDVPNNCPTDGKDSIVPIDVLPIEPITQSPGKPTIQSNPELGKLIALIPNEHRGKKTIIDIVQGSYKEYGYERTARNIWYVNKHWKDNYRNYLRLALIGDWSLGEYEDYMASKQKQQEQVEQRVQQQQLEKQSAEIRNRVNAYLDGLNDEQRQALRNAAIENVNKRHPKLQKELVEVAVTMEMRDIAEERVQ